MDVSGDFRVKRGKNGVGKSRISPKIFHHDVDLFRAIEATNSSGDDTGSRTDKVPSEITGLCPVKR